VFVEEFFVLQDDEEIALWDGTKATNWAEYVHADDAEVLVRFASGPLDGVPAVTRRAVGRAGEGGGGGAAWYVATRLDDQGIDGILDELPISPVIPPQDGVEAVRRIGRDTSYLFIINHADSERFVTVQGHDLVTGRAVDETLRVPAGDIAVVRETSDL
jgi:beta-galactosidase